MSNFVCNLCGHEFKKKHHLKQHQNKMTQCVINTTISDSLPKTPKNEEEIFISIKESEIGEHNVKSIQENNFNISNEINDIATENNTFICKFCEKAFGRNDNLTRHIKKSCKVRKAQIEEKEIIFRQLVEKDKIINKLVEQNQEIIKKKEEDNKKLIEQSQEIIKKKDDDIKKLVEQIQILVKNNIKNKDNEGNKIKLNKSKLISNSNNNINSNNTVNNTVNIQITQFGKEDFNEIDDKDFQKIIRNPRILGVKVPEEILKLLHFNPNYPKFQNFFVSDYNREKIMIHDGKSWILESPDKIKSVLEQIITFGKEKLEEYKEKKVSDEVKNRLKRIEDAIDKCNDDFIDDLKEMADSEVNNKKILDLIKFCEDFQKEVLDKIKKTSYNEGKKIIKYN
jgi:ElaB/YqjD/DUF883 family membrane-anchored ribosome-binding protein